MLNVSDDKMEKNWDKTKIIKLEQHNGKGEVKLVF